MKRLFRSARLTLCIGLIVTIGLWASLSHLTARAASEFDYRIQLNYQLQPDGKTRVVADYRVTNSTANRILASLKVNTPVRDVTEVTARYADGSSLPVSMNQKSTSAQGYTYDYQELTLAFANWPSGAGITQNFQLAYTTSELIDIKGSSRTFAVPSLSGGEPDEDYQVSVSVPADFGSPISSGATPLLDGTDGELIRYRFPDSASLQQAVSLTFGDSTVYQIDFAYPLKNTTSREQVFTVALPPDTSGQKVYVNRIDPAPLSTRLDQDGNVLAEYRVPAHSQQTVHTEVAVVVQYIHYDLDRGGTKSEIPDELSRGYTAPSRYWQTQDAALRSQAEQAVAGQTKVVDIVRSLFELTKQTLTYNNEKIKYNIRQGSNQALRAPENAVCLEYSDLMIALLRSQGIPARMPVGYAYAGSLKQSKAVSDSLHSWVEAYIPGVGWINIDPTWGERFDTFGRSDLDHVTFAIWGKNDSLPGAVMAGQVDQNYQYENTTVTFLETPPQPRQKGHIEATAYQLFPGVTLLGYSITAPAAVAGDNYALQMKIGEDRQRVALGSLAPGQVIANRQILWGKWLAPFAEMLFIQGEESDSLVLAAVTARRVVWPMWVSLGLLAGILIVGTVQLGIRRRRRAEVAEAQRLAGLEKTQAITRALQNQSKTMKSAREILNDAANK